jgi:hypothetical protein
MRHHGAPGCIRFMLAACQGRACISGSFLGLCNPRDLHGSPRCRSRPCPLLQRLVLAADRDAASAGLENGLLGPLTQACLQPCEPAPPAFPHSHPVSSSNRAGFPAPGSPGSERPSASLAVAAAGGAYAVHLRPRWPCLAASPVVPGCQPGGAWLPARWCLTASPSAIPQ